MRSTAGCTSASAVRGRPSPSRRIERGRPRLHRRPGRRELLLRSPRRVAARDHRRPGGGGRPPDRRPRRARPHRRGDPAHPLALRPRRRRRAARAPHGRARVLPGAREGRPRRHHELRPVARLRAVRVLRGRRARRGRRAAYPGRARDRRPLHARPLARPRDLLHPRRARRVQRRRPLPGLRRPHGPPGRRHRDAHGHARGADPAAPRRHDRVPRAHGRDDDRARARLQPLPARALPLTVSPRIQAPRGTFDVLGDDALAREALEGHARRILEAAGYARIETPIFEATELFARGVGASTDVVQKEMYTLDEGPSESLTLRPEGTAPTCRAYLEHGMHKLPQPVKLWYLGAFFRRERPQAGRYRQFWQVGAETIGSEDPSVDAELIVLLHELLIELGAQGVHLKLGSLGTTESRAAYREVLQGYLREHLDELPATVRERIDLNPLRAFDAKDEPTRRVMAGAPRLSAYLSAEDREHFDVVCDLLRRAGVEWELDDTLVRGLDYYTRTIFEFSSDALGAQSGVGGGGRYDGLMEQLGGKPTPGCGWAAGVERILLCAEERPEPAAGCDLFVAWAPERRADAFEGAAMGRRAGLAAQLDLAGRSIKGQMKQADRAGARYVAVLHPDETVLRDMDSGEEERIDHGGLVGHVLKGRHAL